MVIMLVWRTSADSDEHYEMFSSSSKILTELCNKYKESVKFGFLTESELHTIEDDEFLDISECDDGIDDTDEDNLVYIYDCLLEFDDSLKSVIEKELSKLESEAITNNFTFEYNDY